MVQRPAPRDPALALAITRLPPEFGARMDKRSGLDHGISAAGVHMQREADAPIVQVSLDMRRGGGRRYAIGRTLPPLRQENPTPIGSGDIAHKLANFFARPDPPRASERVCDDCIVDAPPRNDHGAVLRYGAHPAIGQAIADWERLFAIFHASATRRAGKAADRFNRHFVPGSSMNFIALGLLA